MDAGKLVSELQVAADELGKHRDGVWFIELAPLTDPALVPQIVAQALNVTEEPGKPLLQALVAALKPKNLLLVLDNCEHLLTSCAQLADTLMRACPNLKILASSREGLGIAGETVYRIPSLSLPDLKHPVTSAILNTYEAVRLFIDRATAVFPAFTVTNANAPALAAVCNRLDGIPLAIELAAARVRSLSVEEINSKLDNRFRLLTGGSRTALPRQQTLRALIDWSYDLLSDQEKTLLRLLSLFAGGWTLAAAEQVSTGECIEAWEVLDLLTSLADKNLVLARTQGEVTRYHLLETVRQYAYDRLTESGESRVVRTRHSDYFLMFAEEINPKLDGSEQIQWLRVLEEEHDNLRQALTWYAEDVQDAEAGEKGLRLAAALQPFWMIRGHLSEGREYLIALLAHSKGRKPTKACAMALNRAGTLAHLQGDYAQAHALHEEGLSLIRELGDKEDIATSLIARGRVASAEGHFQARALYEESLSIYRELGNQEGIACSLTYLGIAVQQQGDYDLARSFFEESLSIYRDLGNQRGIAHSFIQLGLLAHEQQDGILAHVLIEECLALQRDLGNRQGIIMALKNLGFIDLNQGEYDLARSYFQESVSICNELGDRRLIADDFEMLARIAFKEAQEMRCACLWGAAAALRETLGSLLPLSVREEQAREMTAVRATLGDDDFAMAWEQGRSMTMQQIIEYALNEKV